MACKKQQNKTKPNQTKQNKKLPHICHIYKSDHNTNADSLSLWLSYTAATLF